MEATHDEVSSDPALTPFVTATAAEIAYAEELLRQIEQRYLNQPAEPRVAAKAAAD
jgi:hypothetical protein